MKDSEEAEIIKKLEKQPDFESPYALEKSALLYKVGDENQRSDAVMVPKHMQGEMLETYHDNLLTGMHSGAKRTFEKIRPRFYWRSLWKDCQDKAANCISCCQRKPDTQAKQVPLQLFDKFYDCAAIDVVGPLPVSRRSRYRYVLTWTRYVELVTTKAEETAEKYVNHIVATHGIDTVLISDRGSNFMSKLFSEVLKLLGIRHTGWSRSFGTSFQGG